MRYNMIEAGSGSGSGTRHVFLMILLMFHG